MEIILIVLSILIVLLIWLSLRRSIEDRITILSTSIGAIKRSLMLADLIKGDVSLMNSKLNVLELLTKDPYIDTSIKEPISQLIDREPLEKEKTIICQVKILENEDINKLKTESETIELAIKVLFPVTGKKRLSRIETISKNLDELLFELKQL